VTFAARYGPWAVVAGDPSALGESAAIEASDGVLAAHILGRCGSARSGFRLKPADPFEA